MQKEQNAGRNTAAIILIGLGVVFLLGQIFDFTLMGAFWPLLVMLPGLPFLYFAYRGSAKTAGLAVPGAMITGTGAILFYQNLTGHWESWAYIWTLYPVFLGMALVLIGRRTDNRSTFEVGNGFVKWGSIGFIGLWILFEFFLFGGQSALMNILLPLALIGAGALLLLRSRTPEHATMEKPKTDGKARNGCRKSYSEDLQDQIDAALAEPDDPNLN